MKKLKKSLSILLSFIIISGLFTIVPFTANAADFDDDLVGYVRRSWDGEMIVEENLTQATADMVDTGGACERIEYKDACGSEFYSSQEMMMGTFNDEGKFTNCDGGVEPDYKLDPENWYDLTKLNQFIESLNNK